MGSVSNLTNTLGHDLIIIRCTWQWSFPESAVSTFNQLQMIVFKVPCWTLCLKRFNLKTIFDSERISIFMKSPYRLSMLIGGLVAAVVPASYAQDTKYPPQGPYIPTPECRAGDLSFLRPCPEDQIEAWRKEIRHFRFEKLLRVGYDGSYKAEEHGKLLLMAPGKDRIGTLGFRCASDTP